MRKVCYRLLGFEYGAWGCNESPQTSWHTITQAELNNLDPKDSDYDTTTGIEWHYADKEESTAVIWRKGWHDKHAIEKLEAENKRIFEIIDEYIKELELEFADNFTGVETETWQIIALKDLKERIQKDFKGKGV